MKPTETILIHTLMLVDNKTNKISETIEINEEIPLEDAFEMTREYPEFDAVFKLRLSHDPEEGTLALSYPDSEAKYKCIVTGATMLLNGEPIPC